MYEDYIRRLDARVEIMAKINETTIEKYTKIIEIQDEIIREYEKKQQAILLDIQRHLDQRSQVYDKTVDDLEETLENPISLDDDDISGMTGSEFIKHSEKKGAPILVQILNQVRANENHMYALHQRFDNVEPKIHEIYEAQNFEKRIAEMKKNLDDETRNIVEKKTQHIGDENLMKTQMNRVTQALGNAGILTRQLQIEPPPELPNSDTGEDTLEEIIAFHTSRVEQRIEEICYEQAVDVKPSVMTNPQRKSIRNENILEKKPLTARHCQFPVVPAMSELIEKAVEQLKTYRSEIISLRKDLQKSKAIQAKIVDQYEVRQKTISAGLKNMEEQLSQCTGFIDESLHRQAAMILVGEKIGATKEKKSGAPRLRKQQTTPKVVLPRVPRPRHSPY